jgi:hypothetical protein
LIIIRAAGILEMSSVSVISNITREGVTCAASKVDSMNSGSESSLKDSPGNLLPPTNPDAPADEEQF